MRVSVIVLNYNGRQWLDGCLNALALQNGAPSFEIIVADNGSTDGSIVWLAKHHPHVRVLRNGTNLGFAAGNNAGAAQATGDWLVFLNNDTVPEPDWLAELCRPLAEHSDLTMATSRVVFIDDPRVVDSAGDGYLRAGGAYKRGHRADVSGFLESCEVFGACGAAFIVRRDAFHAVGGFDERFFMVYEDVDLSYRLRLAGHRCWYAAGGRRSSRRERHARAEQSDGRLLRSAQSGMDLDQEHARTADAANRGGAYRLLAGRTRALPAHRTVRSRVARQARGRRRSGGDAAREAADAAAAPCGLAGDRSLAGSRMGAAETAREGGRGQRVPMTA